MSIINDETTVQTDTRSAGASATEPVRSSRAWVVTVVLVVAMLALGVVVGWVLAPAGDDSSADEPATWGAEIDQAVLTEIDELLDAYWAGWDAGDGDAVVAVMSTDGTFSSPFTSGVSGQQLADYVDGYSYMQFAQVGPTMVIESRTGYEAVGAELADGGYYLDHYVIVEEDGQLRIESHEVISTT